MAITKSKLLSDHDPIIHLTLIHVVRPYGDTAVTDVVFVAGPGGNSMEEMRCNDNRVLTHESFPYHQVQTRKEYWQGYGFGVQTDYR